MKTPDDPPSAGTGPSGVTAMLNWALSARANEPTEILDDAARALKAPVIAAGREGAVIGPFTLVKLLGQGGFGEVWQAEQRGHIRRTIALKLIKPGMASADVMRRFETERQSLAVMDHPNIARVLDAGATPEGGPWFAMELVDGCAITTWCDEHRLPVRERLGLFLQVCAAVEHAHQKGVLHRDLKPSNILVAEADGQPVPKVIDFGIAKAVGSSPELMMQDTIVRTTKGMLIGTPEYMSPEQAGATPDLDTRSDIYMLGVLLFELLTGRTPLGRRQLAGIPFLEMLRRIREVDPARPSTCLLTDAQLASSVAHDRSTDPLKLSRLLRGDLDWIVLKALHKDRERRYATASDLADDIERHLSLGTVSARPPSRFYQFTRMVRRNKAAAIAVLVSLLSLAGGFGMSLRSAQEARRERDRAVKAELDSETRRHDAEEARKLAEEAEGHAADAAATAEAVKRFLHEDMLQNGATRSVVDRAQVLHPGLTILELLDNASKRLPERFNAQTDPLLEAEIRTTIGLTYVNISTPVPAVAHLRRALDLREKELGADDPLTMESLRFLAVTLSDAGKSEEAVEAAGRLVLRCQNESPPDEMLVCVAKETLATALRSGKKLPEAIRAYEEVLKSKVARLGQTAPETMITINNLAAVLMDSSEFGRALSLLETASASWSAATAGKESPVVLKTMLNLAAVYREVGRQEDALRISQRGYEGLKRTLGENHLDTLRAGWDYTTALITAGKSAEALRVLESVRFYAGSLMPAGDPQRLKIERQFEVLERAAKPAIALASVLEAPASSTDGFQKPAAPASLSQSPPDSKSAGTAGDSRDRTPGGPKLVPRMAVPVSSEPTKRQSEPLDIRTPLQSGGPPNGRPIILGRGSLGGFVFRWSNGTWTSSQALRTQFSSDTERTQEVGRWIKMSAFPQGSRVSITPTGFIIVTPSK